MSHSASRIILRRNVRSAWIWELRSEDGHVCNRSDGDFHTRADAEADALKHGQSLEASTDE